MNNLIIEKLIKSNNDYCPEFQHTNPLLNKNVASALSKSLVKILRVATQNSNLNNNLRLSVLENIRKLCKVHPENHLKVDENLTELLIDAYDKLIQESVKDDNDDIDKKLENFIIKNYKETNVNSTTRFSFNPEIIQALINVNPNGSFINTISKTIRYWNIGDAQYLLLAQELWKSNFINEIEASNDLSIKLKAEIETLLLEISCSALDKSNNNLFEDALCSFPQFQTVIKICSTSCDCFQICCSIFNFIFIASKFAYQMQNLIDGFIQNVKLLCMDNAISILYPTHLTHIVVLMDIDIVDFPTALKDSYIQATVKYLKIVQDNEETDLIMLLSHFPGWFDIYFN